MDIDNSVLVYQVFRYTYLDEHSYSVQMEKKHGLPGETSEQIILQAADEGLLNLHDSQPQEYAVNFDALVDKFYEYWEDELEELNTPIKFDEFLKAYMKAYFQEEENSSLRDMLVHDLYLGLTNMLSQEHLPSDFEEFHSQITHRFEGPKRFRNYIQKGLNNV